MVLKILCQAGRHSRPKGKNCHILAEPPDVALQINYKKGQNS